MTDSDPDNAANEQPNSIEDIEKSRAEQADTKIEKLLTLSPNVESGTRQDNSGNSVDEKKLTVTPPTDYSVLRSYGYSRVELRRVTRYDNAGNNVYEHPWITMVSTFDMDGADIEDFLIFKFSDDQIGIFTGDEAAGLIPIGVDAATDKITTDVEAFDPEQGDAMIPAELRKLVGNEFAKLVSIITACEVDDR